MPAAPKKTQWFFADLVLEIRVEGEERNVVHINTHLLRAQCAEEAFNKARIIGVGHEDEYENSTGQKVVVRFRGLGELLPIYEELEDGAEIWFKERVGLTDAEVAALVQNRRNLSVFKQREKVDVPDYVPARVWSKLEDLGFPQKEKH